MVDDVASNEKTGSAEIPAAATPAAVEIKPTFKLSKPIMAMGKEVSELTFRPPTGNDLINAGNPVVFYPYEDPPKIEHRMPKVVTMSARLSNVPSKSLEKVDLDDLVQLAWVITNWFIPTALALNEADEYEFAVPVNAGNAVIEKLKFRKPIAADIIRVGNPVEMYPFVDPIRVEFDMGKTAAMAALLSETPAAVFETIEARELIGIAWALSPFFMPMMSTG
jgi:hypothetical protein